MTQLSKKLRRVVFGARNSFVLILHPEEAERPAAVEIRLKGHRTGHSITVGGLYVVLAERAIAQRKLARITRRGSLLGGAR